MQHKKSFHDILSEMNAAYLPTTPLMRACKAIPPEPCNLMEVLQHHLDSFTNSLQSLERTASIYGLAEFDPVSMKKITDCTLPNFLISKKHQALLPHSNCLAMLGSDFDKFEKTCKELERRLPKNLLQYMKAKFCFSQ